MYFLHSTIVRSINNQVWQQSPSTNEKLGNKATDLDLKLISSNGRLHFDKLVLTSTKIQGFSKIQQNIPKTTFQGTKRGKIQHFLKTRFIKRIIAAKSHKIKNHPTLRGSRQCFHRFIFKVQLCERASSGSLQASSVNLWITLMWASQREMVYFSVFLLLRVLLSSASLVNAFHDAA